MEYQYSETMKAFMKRKPSIAIRVMLILLAVLLIGGGTYSYLAAEEDAQSQTTNLKEFDPLSPSEEYSMLEPSFLSEEYASNFDESIYYCFAVDEEYNSFIVAIKASGLEQYRDLIDYTYSDTTVAPAAVALRGVPREIDSDLKEMTVESFNAFMGGEAVSIDTFKFMLGERYLDTTQGPAVDHTLFALCVFLAIITMAIYVLLVMKGQKTAKLTKATLKHYSNAILHEVDLELNRPDTTRFEGQKLYFTEHYIVSSLYGLYILPYEDLEMVYGSISRNNKGVVTLVTRNKKKHDITEFKLDEKGNDTLNLILERMKQTVPDIQYGAEDSFFISVTPNIGIEVDTNLDSNVKSNVALGIIGAILGATLGGVIWILIGMVGFVAGIAGYLMMLFAIQGYRRLSGRLDKKGQIISLIVALLMIFAANYSSYALEYFKYYYEGNYTFQNLIRSFVNMSGFLTTTGLWGDFARDLVVGYLLSIWAGFRIIRSVFSNND